MLIRGPAVTRELAQDEAGASPAEYALILAIIGVAVGLSVTRLGGSLSDSLNLSSVVIASSDASDPAAPASRDTWGRTGAVLSSRGEAPTRHD